MASNGETNPIGVTPRGRGAGINPGNRFDRVHLQVLDEHRAELHELHPYGLQQPTGVHTDATRSIINPVDSPDLPFKWTINPYRGCEHGCVYCYARPTHEHLGYSSGIDFESKIVAKPDAPHLLQKELLEPRWQGEPIVMSGVTDPYQPIERTMGITRACLEVMATCGQPVSIITKSSLVTRDIDLLQSLAERRAASVAVSITTLDNSLARLMEPRASSPSDRLRTIERLRGAGIPVMVMIAPVIPALNDRELPHILESAANAGAQSAGWIMLRLPHQVKALLDEWLRRTMPERRDHVLAAVQDVRSGRLYDATFGRRMKGEGARADQIRRMFHVYARRFGLHQPLAELSSHSFDPARLDPQFRLFPGC